MKLVRGRAAMFLVLLVAQGTAHSVSSDQSDEARKPRPKTALVLSGGGARGSAHVGVLKVMEDLRIPVDFVVGTSMGSIVGGMYASGLSPEAMEEGFRTVDWGSAFDDKPERSRIAFRLKEDDFQALLPFELGVGRKGLSRRSGIINGQKINVILRGMVIDAVRIEHFDDLHLPYRAVATDLETGDAVVLERGDLALAMRASMSVPGVFTPVTVDGRVLIDGGLAMNLPVQVALDAGAERIIAVDVGTPPKSEIEDLSAAGVISHTFSLLAKRNVADQTELLSANDLLIVPELSDVSASDFDKLLGGVEIGVSAARAAEAELRSFSVSEREFEEFLERQRSTPREDRGAVIVDRVEVTGVTRTASEYITRRLTSQPGEPLGYEAVSDDLDRIHQLGEFESVDVRVVEDAGATALLYDAQEKSWGPNYLRFGFGVETTFDGDSDFLGIVNFRRAEINRRGGESKTIFTFGDPFSVRSEFFQPLGLRVFHWFVAPNVGFTREKDERFLPGGSLEVVETDTSWAGIDVGVQLRNWGELRVGARRGRFDGEVATGTESFDFEADLGGWNLKATLDQLDDVFFPQRGSFAELAGFFSRAGLGGDDSYDKVLLRSLSAVGSGKNRWVGGLEYGTDLGSDIPVYDEFELGGFLNLSGLTRGQLRGDVKALATAGYYRQMAEFGKFKRKLYAGAFAQAGNTWTAQEQVELGELVYSGTIFVGLETLFVPVYVGWGLAEGGRDESYVFVGRPFR